MSSAQDREICYNQGTLSNKHYSTIQESEMTGNTYNIKVTTPNQAPITGDEISIIENIYLTDKQLEATVKNLMAIGCTSVVAVIIK